MEGSGANGGVNINSGQATFNAGGSVQNGAPLAFDPFLVPANGGPSISSYKGFYVSLSNQLGAMSSTPGTTMTRGGQGLLLSATSISDTLVIYNLTAAQWAALGGFNFNLNQTIVVNVPASGGITGGNAYNLTTNGVQPGNTGTGFGTILFSFEGTAGTVDLGDEGTARFWLRTTRWCRKAERS